MRWFHRRAKVPPPPDPFGEEEDRRSLLEIAQDPEMRAAQAEVDAEPLTPRSEGADPYGELDR